MSETMLESYLARLASQPRELIDSIERTVESIIPSQVANFSCRERKTGLLLGHVQSGKTSQVFGLVSAAADAGFRIFILLTTDSIYLHTQTLIRAHKLLSDFNVCSENDGLRLNSGLSRPLLIILKKNTTILNAWIQTLTSFRHIAGNPLFIVDDEGDAASLNTLVNRGGQSPVNQTIGQLRNLGNSSIYLQVTATPQAVLLQTAVSGWRPEFAAFFNPGAGYLGGRFFYSNPPSFSISLIQANDLSTMNPQLRIISPGLRRTVLTFLLTASHFRSSGENVCNCLIHPSQRIGDHALIVRVIRDFLHNLPGSLNEKTVFLELQEIWRGLQSTKPDIERFERLFVNLPELLPLIRVITINSRSEFNTAYETGFNIVVGGNSLGRGITFPKLQTVYYSRRVRTPQADTYWQHSRMFGYDRDPGLTRVFLPQDLLSIFTSLSEANEALFSQIASSGLEGITLLYRSNVRPTRRNVVNTAFLNLVPGGVNYFPRYPLDTREVIPHTQVLDEILAPFPGDRNSIREVDLHFLIEILNHCLCDNNETIWDSGLFQNCLDALLARSEFSRGYLIVRRERRISRGTGTLLSPDDRSLGEGRTDKPVLTMYRLTGERELGWRGHPLWVPNIKFHNGHVFYNTDD